MTAQANEWFEVGTATSNIETFLSLGPAICRAQERGGDVEVWKFDGRTGDARQLNWREFGVQP